MTTPEAPREDPHIPVLLDAILGAVAPVSGVWLDGTLGAGGYACGLLAAGAERVVAVDRDPSVFEIAADRVGPYRDRLTMIEGRFSELDAHAVAAGHPRLDGVVLDLGVSSMQLDRPERGFSFLRDGPLDMRMSGKGPSAADLLNTLGETAIADILYAYGEERASRRIARAIVAERARAPIETTRRLAEIVAGCLPRARPGQPHPATRSFQALRIAVNDELGELVAGLQAAERALAPGGWLAVVSFHSLEDRIVKRFLQSRASAGGGGSRHLPQAPAQEPGFDLGSRRAIPPAPEEAARNPRARSAKLRLGRRTAAQPRPVADTALGLPRPGGEV